MRFQHEIAIAAPPARVWAVYRDVERWPEWTASVTEVTRLDHGPLRVGHRVRIRQPRLPTAVWTVTELVEGQHWTWTSGGRSARSVAHHRVAPDGDGARAELWVDLSGPLGVLVGKVIGGLTDRYLALEAEGLKDRAERG
ncbi:SRPBCC family protein [Actinokineospora sp. NBRC 105648]|uniref:SRPBCC family protein n=1 Tax=Actinokineospora sp. NBRC 105648 TaxID=3032206 RepID=UPI0024A3ECCA|nr:SRPBCC family protein [Actinokineospora sp. NBRC 105648]GLZ42435.1 hypothetical protein Acsp05_60590 [Actinokineospora sp. NBRC 105648]